MENQINIMGTLGYDESTTQSEQATSSDNTQATETLSSKEVYYGKLPQTNDFVNAYTGGLGLIVLLILLVIYGIKKSLNKAEE